jgi:hypothetical protein
MRGRNMAPSTKARWQWKLRISKWLCKLFPVDCFVVEDIKTSTWGSKKRNKNFSPLELGKKWFYTELGKLSGVETLRGYETFDLRKQYGLKKSGNKSKHIFSAHCVDSWVLANWYTGGHTKPDNEDLIFIIPVQTYKRQLQYLQPSKNNIRKRFGGTRSLGFKKSSIVRHKNRGIVYVGGNDGERISLHSLKTGVRLCQNAKIKDCKFLAYSSWRIARIVGV